MHPYMEKSDFVLIKKLFLSLLSEWFIKTLKVVPCWNLHFFNSIHDNAKCAQVQANRWLNFDSFVMLIDRAHTIFNPLNPMID